ncbi:hypothetical protein CANARDRAFT_30469 [[Candida] arabinofermentans NRRL YB-2248]|uniref:DNA polymerase gamma n=1 Tax=[Candida] arabinofermentans NRRL YB-2248 TaxID=983967 RepID=A0A1E4STT7_9ASCO|nr:hypothetical protein CANARDRAFT_30469 [[Candida] arabinofermentans NRRL YB-2248]
MISTAGVRAPVRVRVRVRVRFYATEKPRINPVGIQHLSLGLQSQLFPSTYLKNAEKITRSNAQLVKLSHQHLERNELLGKPCSLNPPINFQIPKLQGNDLNQHFHALGQHSLRNHQDIVNQLLNLGNSTVPLPAKWQFKSGWTRYAPGKKPQKVDFPLEEGLTFDVEVIYKVSRYPAIATAMSSKAWYGWVSPYLTGESDTLDGHLIPMDTQESSKLIIGHNVSYDRARVLEEYKLTQSKAFFLDTMSLHVAVSGMCSRQRGTWLKYKKKVEEDQENGQPSLSKIRSGIETMGLKELIDNPMLDTENETDSSLADDPWMKNSSLNSLKHVAELHCGIKMDKAARDAFSTEDPQTIIDDFQNLMSYCANDVLATFKVFQKIFPQFREIIPHPVSLAALRHINQSFIPTDKEWEHYITNTERMYQESVQEIERRLHEVCERVLEMKDDPSQPWINDPWLSQLDWTITPQKLTKKGVPVKRQKLPGYPEWYKKLIVKDKLTLTMKTRVSPLLLKLSWENKPIFWIDSKGWCFLVEFEQVEEFKSKNYDMIKNESIEDEIDDDLYEILKTKALFKVPHEDGPTSRTTNLMSKPFLRHFEKGILSSEYEMTKTALQLAVANSYWTSSRERIRGQFVIYNDLNKHMDFDTKSDIGMIIPQIIPMGTITRRAVESTWLTASNAKSSRLGSELKAMVKAPPGYCFVGADVDSEELWIASLVGDSVFKMHGGTAIGWMTLEGTKNEGTDLHSKTAKILGISRNEAKIFNYGRIYGAGVKFATTLLRKFNPNLLESEAIKTSKNLYSATKGNSDILNGKRQWYGGSESIVFNRLEQIAEQEQPKTPVLGAGITSALQRKSLKSNSFLPSRINWAIQSSGVDYLHLLIISMEYLCETYNVKARLSITVHDEIRYMVDEKDKYKCAMMLQVANLWTRAMFCHQLGIDEVPQSCAFFSAVDIDKVLRKEVDLDCITPSHLESIPHGESIDIYRLLEKEEIQEFLKTVNDLDLGEINYPKSMKPSELLDKSLDTTTKNLLIQLQIAGSPKEFRSIKKKYLDGVQHLKNSKFIRENKENFNENIISNGTFGDVVNFDVLKEVLRGVELESEKVGFETASNAKQSKKTANIVKPKPATTTKVTKKKNQPRSDEISKLQHEDVETLKHDIIPSDFNIFGALENPVSVADIIFTEDGHNSKQGAKKGSTVTLDRHY